MVDGTHTEKHACHRKPQSSLHGFTHGKKMSRVLPSKAALAQAAVAELAVGAAWAQVIAT